MFSMFTKAMIITVIIFVPMIIINASLAHSPHIEPFGWTMLTSAGIPLIIILFFAVAIRMKAKK